MTTHFNGGFQSRGGSSIERFGFGDWTVLIIISDVAKKAQSSVRCRQMFFSCKILYEIHLRYGSKLKKASMFWLFYPLGFCPQNPSGKWKRSSVIFCVIILVKGFECSGFLFVRVQYTLETTAKLMLTARSSLEQNTFDPLRANIRVIRATGVAGVVTPYCAPLETAIVTTSSVNRLTGRKWLVAICYSLDCQHGFSSGTDR